MQIHETVPQALLPLMPLLKEELEVEQDGGKRGAAVDLVARLFTQHPSGGAIIEEYDALFEALLKRACDKEVRMRRQRLRRQGFAWDSGRDAHGDARRVWARWACGQQRSSWGGRAHG